MHDSSSSRLSFSNGPLLAIVTLWAAAPITGQVAQSLELATPLTASVLRAGTLVTNSVPAGPISAPITVARARLPSGSAIQAEASCTIFMVRSSTALTSHIQCDLVAEALGTASLPAPSVESFDLIVRYSLPSATLARLSSDFSFSGAIGTGSELSFAVDVFGDGLLEGASRGVNWSGVYAFPAGVTDVVLTTSFDAPPVSQLLRSVDIAFEMETLDGCSVSPVFDGCVPGQFDVQRRLDGGIVASTLSSPPGRFLVIGFASQPFALPNFAEIVQPLAGPCFFVPRPDVTLGYSAGQHRIELSAPASLAPIELFLQAVELAPAGGANSIRVFDAYRVACF